MKLALSSLALGIVFFGCGDTTSNITNDGDRIIDSLDNDDKEEDDNFEHFTR